MGGAGVHAGAENRATTSGTADAAGGSGQTPAATSRALENLQRSSPLPHIGVPPVDADTAAAPGAALPPPRGNPAINNPVKDRPPATTAEEAVTLDFDVLDSDGDKIYSMEENEASGTFLEEKFNRVDTNHDGGIDQFELDDFKLSEQQELEDEENP
jgi:hypothetical protein